jgi:hypothetical protein
MLNCECFYRCIMCAMLKHKPQILAVANFNTTNVTVSTKQCFRVYTLYYTPLIRHCNLSDDAVVHITTQYRTRACIVRYTEVKDVYAYMYELLLISTADCSIKRIPVTMPDTIQYRLPLLACKQSQYLLIHIYIS